jgi:hypothetical protein
LLNYGAVAQYVERRSEVPKVEGSPLLVPPIAFLAQAVEHIRGKDEVIGSNPIEGSNVGEPFRKRFRKSHRLSEIPHHITRIG